MIITRKIPVLSIEDIEFVERKIHEYNGCFHSLYNNFDMSQDPDYINNLMTKFNMTQIGFRSCMSNAKESAEQDIENDNDRIQRIERLKAKIDSGKLTPKQIAKAFGKIRNLESRIGKKACFGGYKEKAEIDKQINMKGWTEETEKRMQDWKESRIRPLCVVGEANEKANRFFDVTKLSESYVIYKPDRKNHVRINLSINRRLKEELSLVSKLALNKEIPVTVSMSKDFVWISYDLEKLYGNALDEKSRREEIKQIKDKNLPKDIESNLIKECYKKWYREQKDRKLRQKNRNRAVSIDMNPGYIGWSVIEKADDGEVKVLRCGSFDFSELTRKTGEKSSSRKSKRLVNKRKYEISICIKKLFGLAEHYRCAYFFIEDLSFDKDIDKKSKETNRKNNNTWNRDFMINCISRGCDEHSMSLKEVNACYTSFIGNIRYIYGDPTSAAVEIGRRGLWQYTDRFYPNVTEGDKDSLRRKFGDVAQSPSDQSWVQWYKTLKEILGDKTLNQILRDKVEDLLDHYLVVRLDSVKSQTLMNVYIKSEEIL